MPRGFAVTRKTLDIYGLKNNIENILKQNLVGFLLKFSRKNNSKRYKIVSLMFGSLFFLAMLPSVFIGIGFFVKNYISISLNKIIEIIVSIIGITAGLYFLIWSTITQWKIGNGTPAQTPRHTI